MRFPSPPKLHSGLFARFVTLLLFLLILPISSYSEPVDIYDYDFEVNGKFYKILSDLNVAFTNRTGHFYIGTVYIPETVTYNGTTYMVKTIAAKAFYKCTGLKSVIISNSVSSIGGNAFESFTGLKSIIIGNNVNVVYPDAFIKTNPESVYINAVTPPEIARDNFSGDYSNVPLNVPPRSVTAYKQAETWNKFDVRPLVMAVL